MIAFEIPVCPSPHLPSAALPPNTSMVVLSIMVPLCSSRADGALPDAVGLLHMLLAVLKSQRSESVPWYPLPPYMS